jgi:hypothetical protein
MDPMKSPMALWSRIADGLMCETCRRYRRGLALVLVLAFVLWISGRWG